MGTVLGSTFSADVAFHFGRVVGVAEAVSVGQRLRAIVGDDSVAVVYQGIAETEACLRVDMEPFDARAGDFFALAGLDALGELLFADQVSRNKDAPVLQPGLEQRHQLLA